MCQCSCQHEEFNVLHHFALFCSRAWKSLHQAGFITNSCTLLCNLESSGIHVSKAPLLLILGAKENIIAPMEGELLKSSILSTWTTVVLAYMRRKKRDSSFHDRCSSGLSNRAITTYEHWHVWTIHNTRTLGVHYCGNTASHIHKLIGMRLPRQLATAAMRAEEWKFVLLLADFFFRKI